MKRLSVVIVVVFALSVLLAACGGGAASDPVGVVKAVMQAMVDKKFDQIASMTCAAQQDKVKQTFNPAGALGQTTGADAAKILDTMTISLQNPEYTKVSEEGDKAVVQLKGKLLIKFDKEKLTALLKDVLKAQGQNLTDEQFTAALDGLTGMMEQGQDMDQKLDVVKENGKWVICPAS
jgi:hypothetical protein